MSCLTLYSIAYVLGVCKNGEWHSVWGDSVVRGQGHSLPVQDVVGWFNAILEF